MRNLRLRDTRAKTPKRSCFLFDMKKVAADIEPASSQVMLLRRVEDYLIAQTIGFQIFLLSSLQRGEKVAIPIAWKALPSFLPLEL